MIGRISFTIFLFWVIFLLSHYSYASFPHAPHDLAHSVSCESCHSDALPDTNRSSICDTCHDPHFQAQLISFADPNFYLATGTIVNGTIADNGDNTTTFTYSTANYKQGWNPVVDNADWGAKTNTGRGLILVVNKLVDTTEVPDQTFEVKSATGTTVTIIGPMETTLGGKAFGVMYGQLLKSEINTPNSGIRAVKLFDPNGGFVDEIGSPAKGICQVCHTQTLHWSPVAPPDDDHYATRVCSDCHDHGSGFKPGASGQGHETHLTEIYGPAIDCVDCHGSNQPPLLADGNNLTNTGVCNSCHSPDGPYDGVDDAAIGAKNNWPDGVYSGGLLAAGKERWCVGCHDSGTSLIGGRQAPDVAGNNTSYGYYVSGHGGSAATECGACHGADMDHNFDNKKTFEAASNNYGPGFRLKLINDQEPMVIPLPGSGCYYDSENYRLCYSCHDEKTLLNDTREYGVYGCASNPYNSVNDPTVTEMTTFFKNELLAGGVHPVNLHWDHLADADKGTESFQGLAPLWYVNGGRSRVSCPTCHNPHGDFHGADIPTTKMTHGTLDIAYGTDANGDYGFIGSNANLSTTCTLVCHFEEGHKWYRDEPGTGP